MFTAYPFLNSNNIDKIFHTLVLRICVKRVCACVCNCCFYTRWSRSNTILKCSAIFNGIVTKLSQVFKLLACGQLKYDGDQAWPWTDWIVFILYNLITKKPHAMTGILKKFCLQYCFLMNPLYFAYWRILIAENKVAHSNYLNKILPVNPTETILEVVDDHASSSLQYSRNSWARQRVVFPFSINNFFNQVFSVP